MADLRRDKQTFADARGYVLESLGVNESLVNELDRLLLRRPLGRLLEPVLLRRWRFVDVGEQVFDVLGDFRERLFQWPLVETSAVESAEWRDRLNAANELVAFEDENAEVYMALERSELFLDPEELPAWLYGKLVSDEQQAFWDLVWRVVYRRFRSVDDGIAPPWDGPWSPLLRSYWQKDFSDAINLTEESIAGVGALCRVQAERLLELWDLIEVDLVFPSTGEFPSPYWASISERLLAQGFIE